MRKHIWFCFICFLTSTTLASLSGCGGSATSGSSASKSAKRGVAYDLASPADHATRYSTDFYPMLWNGNFNASAIVTYLRANPSIKYMLVLNEPNLVSQANVTPQQAAQLWPSYEAVAAQTGVKIVGPAITWGTMPNYQDPVNWLDAFYAAYQAANGNRNPQIDYLAFHWYDSGLKGQLDLLGKYGKP